MPAIRSSLIFCPGSPCARAAKSQIKIRKTHQKSHTSTSESQMKITHQITNQNHELKSQIRHSESETQIEPQTKIRSTHHTWKSHINIRITITNTNQQLGSEAKRNEYFTYSSGNRMQVCDIQYALGRLTSQATGRGGLLVTPQRKEPSLMKGVLGRLEISN